MYALYLAVGRLVLRRTGRERARANAERIVALEERLGIDVEPVCSERYSVPRLVHGLNVGYGLFNVTLTVGWLFSSTVDATLATTASAAHASSRTSAPSPSSSCCRQPPTRPRRLRRHLSEVSGLDLEHLLLRFYNPVAAMPSLHVAFAVVTGTEIAVRTESRVLKVAAHAYAPLAATVVAGTGNHYVLDAVAGAALGAARDAALDSGSHQRRRE